MTNDEPTAEFSQATLRSYDRGVSSKDFAASGYTIVRLIGQGAFGSVFQAKRNSDQRDFAIKLLRLSDFQDNSIDRSRFLREAVVLCQLQHPKIVSFRELGMSGDAPYFVMDYVPTTPWSALVSNLSFPSRTKLAVGVVVHCLEALDFAHGKGIVHRDIKPNNVLLERKEKQLIVRLADFGLAKNYFDAGHSGLTDDRQFGGTVGYIAPELINGFRYFKPVSDQYSMAATLYELLTGAAPIKRSDRVNPIIAIRDNNFTPIEMVTSDCPIDLRNWIHRGLASIPEDRFPTTTAMLSDLKEIYRHLRQVRT